MRQHGAAYATQIVHNAKALGQALEDEGVAVEARDFGYTRVIRSPSMSPPMAVG